MANLLNGEDEEILFDSDDAASFSYDEYYSADEGSYFSNMLMDGEDEDVWSRTGDDADVDEEHGPVGAGEEEDGEDADLSRETVVPVAAAAALPVVNKWNMTLTELRWMRVVELRGALAIPLGLLPRVNVLVEGDGNTPNVRLRVEPWLRAVQVESDQLA